MYETGQVIDGRYEVVECLKSEGMSQVYKARDKEADDMVVVKVLPTAHFSDPHKVVRFVREATYARKLSHPNIAAILADGVDEGNRYLVVEYVDGQDLGALIDGEGRLPEAEAVRIVYQVARALAHIHNLGVIHRDIKPGNILLDSAGNVRLTDFGISQSKDDTRLTGSGEFVGTLHYVSPERIHGTAPVTEASDLYSLGVVTYEMVTGELPFDADNIVQLIYCHLHHTPSPPRTINPTISAEFEAVIMRMLEKKPEKRFRSAGELIEELEARHLLDGVEDRRLGPSAVVTTSRLGREPSGRLTSTAGALEILEAAHADRLTGMVTFSRFGSDNLYYASHASPRRQPPADEASRPMERRGVFFEAGNIIFATSTARTERLGTLLVQRGLLSRGELARAAKAQKLSRRRLGMVLLDMELLTREELHDLLTKQVHEILLDLGTWRSGTYSVREGVGPPNHAIRLRLSFETFREEARQRRRELDRLLRQLEHKETAALRLREPHLLVLLRQMRKPVPTQDLEDLRIRVRMSSSQFYQLIDALLDAEIIQWDQQE